MENTHRHHIPVLVALAILLAACSPNTTTPTPRPTIPPPTLPAVSPTVRPTSIPAAVVISPTPPPPTVPPAAFATAVPLGGNCSNKYQYVSDVSIPDNTVIPAGQVFTKTWRVRNVGTCTWGDGYILAFVRGQAMTSLPSVAVPRTAPNEEADLSVLMTAPTTPGTYQGFWVLKNPQGVALNPNLWVKVVIQ